MCDVLVSDVPPMFNNMSIFRYLLVMHICNDYYRRYIHKLPRSSFHSELRCKKNVMIVTLYMKKALISQM